MVVAFSAKLPVVDEESYLFLARSIQDHMAAPYDWIRAWQPWHSEPPSYDFAHPPLHWIAIATGLRWLGEGPWLRLLVTLPHALLLAWAADRLLSRTTRCDPSTPGTARGEEPDWCRTSGLWLSSPIVVLAITSGFMIDLPTVALGTAALAAWREANDRVGTVSKGMAGAAGIALGLAASTKYPALLLIPVILADAWRRRTLSPSWPLWVGFILSWGGIEGWLWWTYGEPHVWAVWTGSDHIAHGPLAGRVLGVVARLGIAISPLPLLLSRGPRLSLGAGLAGGAALMAWGWPEEVSLHNLLFLYLLASVGVTWTFLAVRSALRPPTRDPDEALLGAAVCVTLVGVLFGHNFASGRYLLPLVIPLAGLAARIPGGRRPVVIAALSLHGILALAMADADARLARSGVEVAEEVARTCPTGRFTGEWAFRWRMEQLGWSIVRPEEELLVGTCLATPQNSVAGPLPWDRLDLVRTIDSQDRSPLRLVDVPGRIGYYAETLGALPVGIGQGPVEQARVYRVAR